MKEYVPILNERQRRWLRFLGVLAGGLLLLWVALHLRSVLTPLLAALAAAYILNPVVTWLEKEHIARLHSTIAIYVVGTLLMVAAGGMLVGAAANEIRNLPKTARAVAEYVKKSRLYRVALPQLSSMFATKGDQAEEKATDEQPEDAADSQPSDQSSRPSTATGAPQRGQQAGRLDANQPTPPAEETLGLSITPELGQFLQEKSMALAGGLFDWVSAFLSNTLYLASLLFLFPMYLFVFLWRFNDIVIAIRDHLPAATRDVVVRIVTTIDKSMSEFFRGRLIISAVVGLITGVGWVIVGVPQGLALGALAGALNLVPFLPILALPPALLLTYVEAAGNPGQPWIGPVIAVAVVFAIAQAIENFLLSPYIMARTSGIHPMTTVVVLLIGGNVAGVLGMLLAIPIASTVKTLAGEFVMPEIRRLAEMKQRGPPQTPAADATDAADAADAADNGTNQPKEL